MGQLVQILHDRRNEFVGFLYFATGLLLWLSLISYSPLDPSWNTVAGSRSTANLIGPSGALLADLGLQAFGIGAYVFPVVLFVLSWRRVRGEAVVAPLVRAFGIALFGLALTAGLSLAPGLRLYGDAIPAGGILGLVTADMARSAFNLVGAILVVLSAGVISFYLTTAFSFAHVAGVLAGGLAVWGRANGRWSHWLARRREAREERRRLRMERRRAREEEEQAAREAAEPDAEPTIVPPRSGGRAARQSAAPPPAEEEEIPIRTLEDLEPEPPDPYAPLPPAASDDDAPPWEAAVEEPPVDWRTPVPPPEEPPQPTYHIPPTGLLTPPPEPYPYVQEELKVVAAAIKSKLEEFKITGSVVQINPGPVVTTYEYKPDAGIKYSRVTTLADDLCLGLRAESVLIERIPGKQTIGIEAPNQRREIISLREVLESEEFSRSKSPLTISLGKDIAGRIKVASLDSMPHLLIAGSTGAGKSVMLNSLIMSILYKSTPAEVRMILIDPKRLEMGLYEGIPHLLTPVITDAKQATNALRNALVEMEQRLRLLAAHGVRNIEQFNRKVTGAEYRQRDLFDDNQDEPADPLPYILIIIDEFADLMMLERANAEGSVTRLAQMARAVGIHLVLATQRPSVDVITGLIKANFPARLSFRVATRVDSRTILDRMGAEHLLGKGDMLFLPPGSSRLIRVHGAFVTEGEIEKVVDFWKNQAQPDYDDSFLAPPPGGDLEDEDGGGSPDEPEDPRYREAVRVVCEAGKASTSILQRRLKLGYGRAARILDMMQRDGIIGPPDGSRPRDVLKPPDWLDEVDAWDR